ncbi:MAG: hypothetical protein ACK45T_09150, partial [Pseudanabaena sp.]
LPISAKSLYAWMTGFLSLGMAKSSHTQYSHQNKNAYIPPNNLATCSGAGNCPCNSNSKDDTI